MKQCAHCGWDTANPTKISVTVRNDFEIRINLCPKCLEAYKEGTTFGNKSLVW